jgi:hypothetical protein
MVPLKTPAHATQPAPCHTMLHNQHHGTASVVESVDAPTCRTCTRPILLEPIFGLAAPFPAPTREMSFAMRNATSLTAGRPSQLAGKVRGPNARHGKMPRARAVAPLAEAPLPPPARRCHRQPQGGGTPADTLRAPPLAAAAARGQPSSAPQDARAGHGQGQGCHQDRLRVPRLRCAAALARLALGAASGGTHAARRAPPGLQRRLLPPAPIRPPPLPPPQAGSTTARSPSRSCPATSSAQCAARPSAGAAARPAAGERPPEAAAPARFGHTHSCWP